ncbi:methyl-accepting chemotaxis protein [Undibacterium sp. Di24W]|uniref:methyl-accepting chemotaxis protein n=1 Tax=Undibacterium sp. Di24W TaxID=3413033 RepID=UPI003BF04694
MSKLSLQKKLLGIFGSILFIGLLFGTALLSKKNTEYVVAKNELYGVTFAQVNFNLINDLQKIRATRNSPNQTATSQQLLRKNIQRQTEIINKNDPLDISVNWKKVADELLVLSEKKGLNSSDIDLLNSVLLKLFSFNELVIEKSGLLFDPEADTYLLMDLSLQKLPIWHETLSQLALVTAESGEPQNISRAKFAQITSLYDRLQLAIQNSDNVYAALLRADVVGIPSKKNAVLTNQEFLNQIQKQYFDADQKPNLDNLNMLRTHALEQIQSLENQTQSLLELLLKDRVQKLNRHAYLIAFTLIASMVAAAYLLMGFYLSVTLAVGNLEFAAKTIASGDLTRTVKVVGSDEFAQTAVEIERANVNLSALVANVRTNASMVLDLGKELSEGIQDMAIRTEQQASSLFDTTQSMGTLSETVRMNAANASSVDNLASNVRKIAESSSNTMHGAVVTMQGIHTSAVKVQEIVGMIDRIAFQTDILALNAAVEASHAGEHGKGFAVVATEVRNLAQRSADAARQIRRLIEDSVNRVETGVEQIYDVNDTLSKIVSGIQNLAKDINAISTASTEQSNNLASISEAIHDLDEITKSNSQMAENAKFASSELEIRAAKLTSVVSAFKLRQGTADEASALVRKAKSLFAIHGMDLLTRITDDPEKIYVDRDMYVFAFDRQGQYRAYAGNESKLSINLFNVTGLDGRKLVEDAFALPEKGGWVDYAFENPLLGRIELKTSYIEKISDDIVIGCGVYKSL